MSLKKNIIYIYFKGKHLITSKSQYQYNHGQYLYFADLNLPQAFEVHFSNKERGESKTQIGSNKLVEIPDKFFWSGALQIYAWVYLHDGTDDGETIYEVRIPLIKRAKPIDEEPLPAQQLAIDKAIAELNNAVDITNENADKTNADKIQVATIKEEVVVLKEEINTTASTVNQDAQTAQTAAERSEQSAQNSAESERKALDYSDEAKGYAQSAFESKDTASQKAQVATDAAAEAKGYRDEAETFKNEAKLAKQNIVDYRDETKGYRDETLTAKDDVQTIKGDVQSLKTQIDDTADNVFENAHEAYQSMISADNASLSASESAENASRSANEANQSATNASESASQAEEFKNQSATNVTHYPKVIDGYWHVWDASKNDYVNTNVDARGIKGDKGDIGKTGNGIENTVLNSDYTLTITFTDGTSYTTPSIRGEKGIKGDVGNGIASTVLNNDYTLTINFTNGTQYTTPPIRGKQGEKGDQGEVGESGVYIGAEEPINEDIKVWIDTDEEGFDVYESINKLNNDVEDLNEKISILANRGNSWKEIRQNVKMGYGETLYPVGTDFEVECTENSPYQSIVFTVVDHSIIDDEPCMTLLMKNCINGLQFEHEQALIVPTETLVAGTYHFNFPNNYDASYDGTKTVQFTLVNDVQANDQIMIQYPSNQSWIGKNLTVYSNFTNTVLETCVMSEGEDGTDLGIADGSGIINHITRARYGANNWKESAVRQWLNTDVLVNEWQTQQNRYQRPCTYLTKQNGFMSWFNSDFIGVIKETNHLNRTNRIYDSLGVKTPYSTDDKFFLLSQEEVGFNSEDNIICGTCFDYYNGAENIDRIKYDINNGTTARWWWLRTPYPSNAGTERNVNGTGSLYNNYGYNGNAVASACTI